jgi:hypothetical protein
VLAEALFLLPLPQPEITAARPSGAAAAPNRLTNMLAPPDFVVSSARGDRRATPTAESRTYGRLLWSSTRPQAKRFTAG